MDYSRRWIRNRVTEREVRALLDARGYDGRRARFERLELAAIRPPGWVQLFSFEVELPDEKGKRAVHYGLLRDDERSATRLHLSKTPGERDLQFEEWAEGMIVARSADRRRRGRGAWLLLALALAAVVLFVLLGG